MIEMSVVMPLFRSKYIGWLPFESLCRQEDIDFEWELLIAEEIYDEAFGEKEIMKYESRLKDVGCVRIDYTPYTEWKPLGTKWSYLAKRASDTLIMTGHPSDYYAAPGKLAKHYKVFTEDKEVTFHIPRFALHYLVRTGEVVLQNTNNNKRKDHCIGKAWLTGFMQELPENGPRTSVDGWLYKNYLRRLRFYGVTYKSYPDNSDIYKGALSTTGFNNISPKGRLPTLNKMNTVYTEKLEIPQDILDRLIMSKEDLRKHKKSLPQFKVK